MNTSQSTYSSSVAFYPSEATVAFRAQGGFVIFFHVFMLVLCGIFWGLVK